jgi:APA family basic amino acid/polyamine antiporter
LRNNQAESETQSNAPISAQLGLWDAVSIIVGIVVGTSIFRNTAIVFDQSGSPWVTMALWLVGGLLAWCGAVCYAELAVAYPRDGGDYEYLYRAFGRWCGFLFAWAQLTTVISGNIAIMAYAFADYAVRAWPGWKSHGLLLTIAPIAVLSALNALGIVAGKATQNILSATKVLGLGGLIIAGALTAPPATSNSAPSPASQTTITSPSAANIGLALVFVLYAYGGWTHAAYVAAEVRDERRNLPRALIFGVAGITLIYLAVNAAYLHALGFTGARTAATPAADVLEQAIGPWGGRAISILVMLSALGAINGMILTASRIYAVCGADYPAIAWLGRWNRRTAAPIAAIALQAIIAAALIALVGTESGRNTFDAALRLAGINGLPWEKFSSGFETLVVGSAPVYWGLCLLTGLAIFVLRASDRDRSRPYKMPGYPLPALAFCATCIYMLWASLEYARWLTLIGLAPLALGLVVWLPVRLRSAQTPQ